MAYTATVIPIMIASPGDVLNERNVAREVISAWNDVHSLSTKTILTSVGWDTHASPDLGDRAQTLINDRVLKDCDLLVGIFWTRLGTPTGTSASGSVEEIEKHIAAGKPAMVYFSNTPVALNSVDLDQYEALKQFRKWCEGEGLIATYDNLPDFERVFTRDLQINLYKIPYLISLRAQSGPTNGSTGELLRTQDRAEGLSNEAKELLREAADDRNGSILKVSHLGGTRIQTNGKLFGEGGDRRIIARWEYAIEQLVAGGLVDPKGDKGQIFIMTAKGYEVADRLKSEPT
jgi:hypothetical protein